MNIHAKKGDKVMFIGVTQDQILWGNCDNPNDKLLIGNQYTVEKTEIHSWHTKVSIKEVEGKFPSEGFEDIK